MSSTDLVVVTHNGALEFGGIDPCHKVFHMSVIECVSACQVGGGGGFLPCYEECRICYCIRSDSYMSLLYKFDSLEQPSVYIFHLIDSYKSTHRADCLGHLCHGHDHGQSSPAKRRDSKLVLNVAELCCRVEHSHVVQFR